MTKISLSRAWEDATAVLARDGRLFVAVALALFVLPGLVLDVALPEAPAGELPPIGPWVAVGIIAVVLSLVGQLSVIRLALHPNVSVGEAITHGARRFLAYLAAVLLWSLPVILVAAFLYAFLAENPASPSTAAAVVLIVVMGVGMFLAVRLMVASVVASAEDSGPIAILQRSWALTGGNWWRLFAFLLLVVIGAIVLITAVGSVAGLLARLVFGDIAPGSIGGLAVGLVGQLLSGFISVSFFVMVAQIYRQLAGGGETQPSVPRSGT